jgi:hypothetical protein
MVMVEGRSYVNQSGLGFGDIATGNQFSGRRLHHLRESKTLKGLHGDLSTRNKEHLAERHGFFVGAKTN